MFNKDTGINVLNFEESIKFSKKTNSIFSEMVLNNNELCLNLESLKNLNEFNQEDLLVVKYLGSNSNNYLMPLNYVFTNKEGKMSFSFYYQNLTPLCEFLKSGLQFQEKLIVYKHVMQSIFLFKNNNFPFLFYDDLLFHVECLGLEMLKGNLQELEKKLILKIIVPFSFYNFSSCEVDGKIENRKICTNEYYWLYYLALLIFSESQEILLSSSPINNNIAEINKNKKIIKCQEIKLLVNVLFEIISNNHEKSVDYPRLVEVFNFILKKNQIEEINIQNYVLFKEEKKLNLQQFHTPLHSSFQRLQPQIPQEKNNYYESFFKILESQKQRSYNFNIFTNNYNKYCNFNNCIDFNNFGQITHNAQKKNYLNNKRQNESYPLIMKTQKIKSESIIISDKKENKNKNNKNESSKKKLFEQKITKEKDENFNKELEIYEKDFKNDLETCLTEKRHIFMKENFPVMYNLKNFYSHFKKVQKRRTLMKEQKKREESTRIEKILEGHCSSMKKKWSCRNLGEKELEEYLKKCENIWPLNQFYFSQEACLEFLFLNHFQIDTTLEFIKLREVNFVQFLEQKGIALNHDLSNHKNTKYSKRIRIKNRNIMACK
jgi:hypothetical protein